MGVSYYNDDNCTQELRMSIYKMAGEGFSLQEISNRLKKIWSSRFIRKETIEKILLLPEARKFVNTYRTAFLKTIKEIPIAEKKTRLDDLEKMRQRLEAMMNKCLFERAVLEEDKFLRISSMMIKVLDIARNEMEQHPGVQIGIGIGRGELGDLSDEDLKREREELLRRARVIIKQSVATVDEITEGDESADEGRSAAVLLAASGSVRRDELPIAQPDISDIRQQKSVSEGMSAG